MADRVQRDDASRTSTRTGEQQNIIAPELFLTNYVTGYRFLGHFRFSEKRMQNGSFTEAFALTSLRSLKAIDVTEFSSDVISDASNRI